MISLPNPEAPSKPGKKKDSDKHYLGESQESGGGVEIPRVSEIVRRARDTKGGVFLSEVSPRDSSWDDKKAQADLVGGLYAEIEEFIKHAERMCECARCLEYAFIPNGDTGEFLLRLLSARFCRLKFCPLCNWRRSLMRLARFMKFIEFHGLPPGRWIHLTLTVKNVPLVQLGATLKEMTRAFRRMTQRKGWPAWGFIRSTEITRAENDFTHPHFHVLLYVPHSYFTSEGYLNQREWIAMWRKALRADYDPSVRVQAFRMKTIERDGEVITLGPAEILKYAVKGIDLIGTKKKPGPMRNRKMNNAQWLAELTRQTKSFRFIAAGGCLKSVFKEEKENDDLLRPGETTREEMEELARAWFIWQRFDQRYRRSVRRVAG